MTTPTSLSPRFAYAVHSCLAIFDDPAPSRGEVRSEREFAAAVHPRLIRDFTSGRRHLWVEPSPSRH